MAEIKSTLDLVMEKTRHLTLSDEEKQEQKENEFKIKLKGPAQKFQDQTINKRELKKEINNFSPFPFLLSSLNQYSICLVGVI